MDIKNFIEQEQAVEELFYEYMTREGYSVRLYKDEDLKYLGYGGNAIKEDKFAVIFNLRGQVYPRTFSISVEDRNGNLVIMGETAAIYSISATSETTKEELSNKFKILLSDIYNKYKIYSRENRLDFVYNELEMERKNYTDIEKEVDLYELIDNYCENCTDKEWEELANDYCISEDENYMGEVREKLEEAIIEGYKSSNQEEKEQLINRLSKYMTKEKEYNEQEEELER